MLQTLMPAQDLQVGGSRKMLAGLLKTLLQVIQASFQLTTDEELAIDQFDQRTAALIFTGSLQVFHVTAYVAIQPEASYHFLYSQLLVVTVMCMLELASYFAEQLLCLLRAKWLGMPV